MAYAAITLTANPIPGWPLNTVRYRVYSDALTCDQAQIEFLALSRDQKVTLTQIDVPDAGEGFVWELRNCSGAADGIMATVDRQDYIPLGADPVDPDPVDSGDEVVYTGAVSTFGSDNPNMLTAEVYDLRDDGTYRVRNQVNYSASGGKTIKWIPNDSGFINASEIANRRFRQGVPLKLELWAVNEGAGLDGYRLNNPDHAQQILTVQ